MLGPSYFKEYIGSQESSIKNEAQNNRKENSLGEFIGVIHPIDGRKSSCNENDSRAEAQHSSNLPTNPSTKSTLNEQESNEKIDDISHAGHDVPEQTIQQDSTSLLPEKRDVIKLVLGDLQITFNQLRSYSTDVTKSEIVVEDLRQHIALNDNQVIKEQTKTIDDIQDTSSHWNKVRITHIDESQTSSQQSLSSDSISLNSQITLSSDSDDYKCYCTQSFDRPCNICNCRIDDKCMRCQLLSLLTKYLPSKPRYGKYFGKNDRSTEIRHFCTNQCQCRREYCFDYSFEHDQYSELKQYLSPRTIEFIKAIEYPYQLDDLFVTSLEKRSKHRSPSRKQLSLSLNDKDEYCEQRSGSHLTSNNISPWYSAILPMIPQPQLIVEHVPFPMIIPKYPITTSQPMFFYSFPQTNSYVPPPFYPNYTTSQVPEQIYYVLANYHHP
ncbi:unnamed protein product [Schistosoma turkestanicum]|nr:unnamed protein product [Schistosoma turkestanicum]